MDFRQTDGPGLPPGMSTPPQNNGYTPLSPGSAAPGNYRLPQSDNAADIPPNAFSTASLVLGILSIVSLCLLYFSPLFAGLSILFALLSKGYRRKMNGMAKAGIITSICGLVIWSVIWICLLVYTFRLMTGDSEESKEFWRSYKQMGEQLYGDDFDDLLKQQFGDDFDIDQYLEGGALWILK